MNSHDVQRTSQRMHRQRPALVLKIKNSCHHRVVRVLAGDEFEVILV